MKKIITLLFFYAILISAQAQTAIAYYDAQTLKGDIDPVTKRFVTSPDPKVKEWMSVLNAYLPKADQRNNWKPLELAAKYNDNIILKPYLTTSDDWKNAGVGSDPGTIATGASGNILGAAGGLDVTNFAVGLANFLIERTKQEAYVNFFQQFKDFLDCNPEVKKLFPNTYQLLLNFDSWNYANFLITIREALDKDLQSMMFNMAEFRNVDNSWCAACECNGDKTKCKQTKCQERMDKYKKAFDTDEARLMFAALIMGDGIIKGTKIPTILQQIADDNKINKFTSADVTNGINLLAILSSSIASNDAGRSYIKVADLAAAGGDKDFWNLYMGLVYQEIDNKKVTFNGKLVTDDFKNYVNNPQQIITYINSVVTNSEDVYQAIIELKKAKAAGSKDLTSQIGNLFQVSATLISSVGNITFINLPATTSAKISAIVSATSTGLNIANDITVKNYSRAVVDVMNLLTQIPDLAPGKANNDFVRGVIKWSSFAANVITAQSPDAVKSAIEGVALPVGSASIKKNLPFNISVNAYTGVVSGGVFGSNHTAGTVALYAPVGFDFSWKTKGCNPKYNGAISIEANLLDLGAVLSYELTNTKNQVTANDFKVRLEDIFAPGLNIIGAFPRYPISMGFGTQWMPALVGTVTTTGLSVTNQTGMRLQAFLAFDIPMINLFSKVDK